MNELFQVKGDYRDKNNPTQTQREANIIAILQTLNNNGEGIGEGKFKKV